MYRFALAPAVLALTFFTANAQANIDQLKGLLGDKKTPSTVTSTSLTDMASNAVSGVDLASLVGVVSDNLNITETQSEGGIASIMHYVQGNLSGADYKQLASSIPGINSLLENVPSLSSEPAASKSSSLSGLLNKASEYNTTLKSVNDLKQQFEALGLSTDMIASVATQISKYLNVNADEKTQALFKSGLDNLLTAL